MLLIRRSICGKPRRAAYESMEALLAMHFCPEKIYNRRVKRDDITQCIA